MDRSFSDLRKGVTLIDAVRKNDVSQVRKLLARGVDPNITIDRAMVTPLHFAVQSNALDVVPLLLAAGARLDSQTEEQETPLDVAKLSNQGEMLELLKQFAINNEEK